MRLDGSAFSSAVNTSSGSVAVALASRYCRIDPLYSGIRSTEPSLSAGTYFSRLPMLSLSLMSAPCALSASA